ncbi:MAG TPA: hypothetical protein VKA27_06845 [Sunxiuqinia sp.]|nr:hypothetical protein [Sunxiuqinia sp.]
MENDELQKIWKSMGSEFNQKTKDELSLLLSSKVNSTIHNLLKITAISIFISIGLIVYLIITTINRPGDTLFLIDNLLLVFVTAVLLVFKFVSWYHLQTNKFNKPLNEWLKMRIDLLQKYFTGKRSNLYLVLIPVLYILLVLSIHVYFENKPFIEVIHSSESLIGLSVGVPIGLFVAFYSVRKIRKYQLKNLRFLQDLHKRINHLDES